MAFVLHRDWVENLRSYCLSCCHCSGGTQVTGINQFFIFLSKCLVTTLFFFHQLFEVGASQSETP